MVERSRHTYILERVINTQLGASGKEYFKVRRSSNASISPVSNTTEQISPDYPNESDSIAPDSALKETAVFGVLSDTRSRSTSNTSEIVIQ